MRSFQKLIVPLLLTSASALDIRQLIQQAAEHKRELQDESTTNLFCLLAALTFGSNSTDTPGATDPMQDAQDGVLFDTLNLVLGSELETICPDPSDCDLAGTALYEEADGICANAQGQLVPTDLAICKDTLLTLADALGAGAQAEDMLDGVTDINVSNIPICVPPEPICPADFDLFPALDSVLDLLVAFLPANEANSPEIKAALDAVSKVLEGEDCSAGSSMISSIFLAGVLAVGASLFATL